MATRRASRSSLPGKQPCESRRVGLPACVPVFAEVAAEAGGSDAGPLSGVDG